MKTIYPKEKGQGLLEYLMVLVFVAIVVIAAISVIDSVVRSHFPDDWQPNASILSDVEAHNGPESWNPALLLPETIEPGNTVTRVGQQSCVSVSPPRNKALKVGTTYQDPTLIVVSPNGDGSFSICNHLVGADVYIYIAYSEVPQ